MTKYRAINGWTRASMKARIREGNNGTRAVDGGACSYLTPDGNKCFVGVFIPDGHKGQRIGGGVDILLGLCPDLSAVLPLCRFGCSSLQSVHDLHDKYVGSLTLHELADEWIDANVLDPGEPVPDGEDVA